MFSFKKQASIYGINLNQLEETLRKFSIKRHTSLDFQSSAIIAGKDQHFIGLNGERSIEFTRIRSSFASLLPKLIIVIPHENENNYFTLRLSILSTVWALLIFSAIIVKLFFLTVGKTTSNNLVLLILFNVIYWLEIYLEARFTESEIKKLITPTISPS